MHRNVIPTLTIFAVLVALLSACGQRETVLQSPAAKKSDSNTPPVPIELVTQPPELEARRHVAAPNTRVVGEVKFEVDNSEDAADGPSPYVSIEDPSRDLQRLRNAGEIVVPKAELTVVIDYPVTGEWEIRVSAPDKRGFSRAELARTVSKVYQLLYREEERTTKTKVTPRDQRKGLINRNRTDGMFGIWGHDIGDLLLNSVELHEAPDGRLFAYLSIDS